MTTIMKKKPRIAISVDKGTEEALKLIAKRDKVPVASKAGDLLRLALEIDEDVALGDLMEERMKDKNVQYIPFDEVWCEVFPKR